LRMGLWTFRERNRTGFEVVAETRSRGVTRKALNGFRTKVGGGWPASKELRKAQRAPSKMDLGGEPKRTPTFYHAATDGKYPEKGLIKQGQESGEDGKGRKRGSLRQNVREEVGKTSSTEKGGLGTQWKK